MSDNFPGQVASAAILIVLNRNVLSEQHLKLCCRYMFWSDWGETPKIARASMDGSDRKNVITTDIKWPNGLAVDYNKPRLYWLDAHKEFSRLESSDLDGNDRKKLISSSLPHPFSITIHGNRVFWTDWERMSIESCNKNNGHEKWLVKDEIKSLMALRAFEPETQPQGIVETYSVVFVVYSVVYLLHPNN